jgi:protein arginine N-methyltransferase 1
MSCIKKQAMMEPLVDTVDANQIVTNCQLLKVMAHFQPSYVFFLYFSGRVTNQLIYLVNLFQTMDISKMSSGDASFTVPFKLVAERNDFIHALVAYFNVSFTKCHKLMGFSTGLFILTFCYTEYGRLAPFFMEFGE